MKRERESVESETYTPLTREKEEGQEFSLRREAEV